jgi:hypothetical protein
MKTRFALVLIATSLAGSLAQAATNVFVAGFETTDTPTYANGNQIHNVPLTGGASNVWNWGGGNVAVVTNAPEAVHSGSQGLYAIRSTDVNTHTLWTKGTNAFVGFSNGIVELKADIKIMGWANSQSSFLEIAASDSTDQTSFGGNSTRSGWVTLKGNGTLQGWNGSGSEPVLLTGIALTNWHTLRMDVNLDSNRFNVFFDGLQVATNFSYYGGVGVDWVHSLQFKEGNNSLSTGGFYLDNILIQAVPEPSAAFGITAGLGFLIVLRRRAHA